MTQQIQQKLSDSKIARWSVLALAAFTMLCGYFLTDVMAPLKPMLEEQLAWSSTEYGFFTSAYGWFNVFLFMLIIGGIILDKMGVRFTGVSSCILMIIGCSIKYYAISDLFAMDGELFGWKAQVMVAALGYALFGVGVETAGITVSKIIVRWFKGKETEHFSTNPVMPLHALHRLDRISRLLCHGPQARCLNDTRGR